MQPVFLSSNSCLLLLFFFFPERAPHVLQLSLRPQGGPLSLIERRSRRGRWEEGSWWWPPLRQTRRELRGFNIQPVVPVFMIREASKPDLVVQNAEEIIDAAAAACESLWTSSKTLMQIDNVASLSLSLCRRSIKRAHVNQENRMCVKCKQIKADLELRRFNRLHFFFLLLLLLSSENNKQHLENYKGYTPQN